MWSRPSLVRLCFQHGADLPLSGCASSMERAVLPAWGRSCLVGLCFYRGAVLRASTVKGPFVTLFSLLFRCISLPSALAASQCSTMRWFSKKSSLDGFQDASSSKEPPKHPMGSFLLYVRDQRALQKYSGRFCNTSLMETCLIL